MQEKEQSVKKAREIQPEVMQAKIGEDVLEHRGGNLIIHEDAKK